ncbi:hypothetical protein BGZ63DRAFT_450256 [Mariannaea sp. PMI_226]|nr:hypothetical protein BGZ63DRAFT_450256 [Mariannaea sp. PMI_226]
MSLYQQSVPVLIKYLKNLSGILQKGAKFCEEKAIKPDEMISYRLIADMRGLSYQVQSCSNTAKFAVQRLGVTGWPTFEDNEATFDELEARIQQTIELLQKTEPEDVNSRADKEVIMETKMGNFRFETGQTYISEYIIPNFHFHLTSAYCILRTQGVPVGALDYLKDVFHKQE